MTVTNNDNFVCLFSDTCFFLQLVSFPFSPTCLLVNHVKPSIVVHSDLLQQVSIVLLFCSLLCSLAPTSDHSVSLSGFSSTDSFDFATWNDNVETFRVSFNSATSLLSYSSVTYTTISVSCNCLYSTESFCTCNASILNT